ncbi:MAG: hypothetical protein ABI134_24730 [Byssovorax sp.]
MTAASLFALLWESLADVLGTAATAVLLRRALKRAAARYPALHDLTIKREGLDYAYSMPRAWQEQTEGSADASLQELIVELRPLLVELTGGVVFQRLERVPALRALNLVPPERKHL